MMSVRTLILGVRHQAVALSCQGCIRTAWRTPADNLASRALSCYARAIRPASRDGQAGRSERLLLAGATGNFTDGMAGVMLTHAQWYSKVTADPATEEKTKVKVRGIQKDVSPLSTRRILRRKKTADSPGTDKIVFEGVAYATAEEINLENLRADLEKQGLYIICKLPMDVTDALHVEAKYRVDDERREIFFFREGSVVFWNMPEEEKRTVLQFLRRHQQDSYDSLLIEQNFEKIDFTYTDSPSQLVGDEIQLQRLTEPSEETAARLQLDKYTFSNALALSVKLSIWEASLERYVDSIEYILQDLKAGKKLKMSREEVLRKTGELFTLRHLINLSSDLLDTPDFYWDRDAQEQHYTTTCTHLNIARRTKVMNEKLTYCVELIELVREHLNDKHSTQLEWMIIILILIEVIFEILHIVERHS